MTSRELALLTWMGIFTVLVFLFPETRLSTFDVVKKALKVIKEPVFKIIIGYQLIMLLVVIIFEFGTGISWIVIKDYFQVLITVIVPFLVKTKVGNFWRSLIESIGIGALFEFFISSFTFPYYIELILLPVILFSLLIISLNRLKKFGNLKKIVESFLNLIGNVMIIFVTFRVFENIGSIATFDFWEGYLIEPIAWIVNIPLILLSVPIFQYDIIDNFRNKSKSVVGILWHTATFILGMLSHLWLLTTNVQKYVVDVSQGGVGRRRIQVYVSSGVSSKGVKHIQNLYKYMLAPRKSYYHGEKIIPIRVECHDASTYKLKVPIYELKSLANDYKIDVY
ncbi:hypothetical protein [Ligilactobacillus acidipiscis]|uniref:Integral membrane protein n=1 Tax=Ligilactobacillus acidipiscis TaxID=89059 RepID=A0A0R2K5B5_9LACO|nr:hypothetical protein [Ligilactobacillus acidipiscis]KRN84786.1 integral membrane protein [Ligilactobacillus acidipiscis]